MRRGLFCVEGADTIARIGPPGRRFARPEDELRDMRNAESLYRFAHPGYARVGNNEDKDQPVRGSPNRLLGCLDHVQ